MTKEPPWNGQRKGEGGGGGGKEGLISILRGHSPRPYFKPVIELKNKKRRQWSEKMNDVVKNTVLSGGNGKKSMFSTRTSGPKLFQSEGSWKTSQKRAEEESS